MSSDIDGKVIAIQGESISNAAPSNGNVLTWDNADGYWVPRSGAQNKQVFTTSGSWTCPTNVFAVWIIAWGGGGGGGSGTTAINTSSGAGGGSVMETRRIEVVPGTLYSITIGNGGTAANDGQSTAFDTLSTFLGASRGGFPNQPCSGGNAPGIVSNAFLFTPGFGGNASYMATSSSTGFSGGVGGGNSGSYQGGGGGGGGPAGAGGAGGNGNNSGTGANGSSAANNSGAGGGAGGCGSVAGGAGGLGGSGQLTIIW